MPAAAPPCPVDNRSDDVVQAVPPAGAEVGAALPVAVAVEVAVGAVVSVGLGAPLGLEEGGVLVLAEVAAEVGVEGGEPELPEHPATEIATTRAQTGTSGRT